MQISGRFNFENNSYMTQTTYNKGFFIRLLAKQTITVKKKFLITTCITEINNAIILWIFNLKKIAITESLDYSLVEQFTAWLRCCVRGGFDIICQLVSSDYSGNYNMAFYQSVKVLQTFCFLNWVKENTNSKHIFSLLSTIRLDEYHPWHSSHHFPCNLINTQNEILKI